MSKITQFKMKRDVSLFVLILTATSVVRSQPTVEQTDDEFFDNSNMLVSELSMLRAKLQAMEESLSFNADGMTSH